MRCHCATEIAGQQDCTEDRCRRNGIEHGADDGDDTKASREILARTVAHFVHRFRDDRPRHQLDGTVEQQEYDNKTAEHAAEPARRFRDWHGLGDISHGLLLSRCPEWLTIERRTRREESDKVERIFHYVMPGLVPAMTTS